MADELVFMVFSLLSSLIACLELNVALINLQAVALRRRQNVLRSLLLFNRQQQLERHHNPYRRLFLWRFCHFYCKLRANKSSLQCFRASKRAGIADSIAGTIGACVFKKKKRPSRAWWRKRIAFQPLVWAVENDVKTPVWTQSFLSVFGEPKTEVFKNALVWTGLYYRRCQ